MVLGLLLTTPLLGFIGVIVGGIVGFIKRRIRKEK